ncbi:T7SS effector LXG polymorphic toxin [Bacillus sonorensis]|uniref:T7SS effector LXG polymorphic toxin n=1 Tax=Bacillus TaxID=1386 RepID=UPI000497E73E|nr:T7SS effector LXG polymorphic toxin [Bacillus sonorensis]MCY7856146.1 T7SS effector LXG polymorphic toxin [Bacillus sonorensis]MCY8090014.1 T7SS effector LXG polymorphic toxin [Bacillus sonorensis]MCY8269240.1 T7SS effector LXG polymorphic toxin [Bacillus sonorensis]MCY8404555.1 T7SS effector LXG polymorphic toxin [Bacillus sonorensis]MCY8603353.1 T7SS effector LXG polymorphic toxin [Bacillus sonorensis]
MKTLDVQALHHAIDQTLEQLKKQSDEIANVKKSVEGITSLDDALKGKGGDAIRSFYEECHTPFLRFYESFIEEYQSTLKKIKNALNSLEPNHNGFISQSFLEYELEQGLNAADRTTKHLVSKANASIVKVSHIVDLPDLNDNDFHEQNRKALTDINQTIEKLHTFDREQTNALKTAENDLETMQKYIARLEKMYTGPKIEITGYQKGTILKPDEMDNLSGNQETAMSVMLKKVGDKEDAEISNLADPDRLKKLAMQKVPKKVYTDEEIENLSKDELAKLKKVYKFMNGHKYCFYMDGKYVVGIQLVDDPPEEDEEVSDLEKYAGLALEFSGESDFERAALGYDPDTYEKLSLLERFEAAVNLTPPFKVIKWIRRGDKLAKVSRVQKGAKITKKASKAKVHTPDSIRKNLDNDILDVMEKNDGHLIKKHLGKSNEDLIKRANKEGVDSTTFTNKKTAIKAAQQGIRKHAKEISEWLNNPDSNPRLVINTKHGFEIGKGVSTKNQGASASKQVTYGLKNSRIILKKDSSMENGYKIVTGFPVVK